MAIEIHDYVAPVKINPYAGDIADLMSAGEGKLGVIVVPTAEAPKAKLAISRAANDAGFTASYKSIETVKGGKTALGFVLVTKHAPRRGK